MRARERDGVALAFLDTGSGDPPFVFVHGWTCNRSFFAPQIAHFARQHRVVSIDLRGHGDSDKPQGSYTRAQDADDIAFVIEQLGLGPVVAVGHSMGGTIVLQLAATHPACVAAIVMVDPAPFVFAPEQRTGVEAMVAAIEAGNQEPRRQFIANLFLPTSDRKLVEDVLAVMLATPSHVAASAMRGDVAFDGPAVAAQCKVPALHLVAASPPLNPPHLMAQWLPTVVHGWTVGAGHFNQLEVPDQVNAMIEGFLRHHV
jgi:pimeloyl-ACP methyl ester carboxylesterase